MRQLICKVLYISRVKFCFVANQTCTKQLKNSKILEMFLWLCSSSIVIQVSKKGLILAQKMKIQKFGLQNHHQFKLKDF